MPYIKKPERLKFEEILEKIPEFKTKGELEYCIFWLMKAYMEQHEFRYSDLHDCTYSAQHCADEFRRRFLDKREDDARETNGDI